MNAGKSDESSGNLRCTSLGQSSLKILSDSILGRTLSLPRKGSKSFVKFGHALPKILILSSVRSSE
jgi:hypothetical protein